MCPSSNVIDKKKAGRKSRESGVTGSRLPGHPPTTSLELSAHASAHESLVSRTLSTVMSLYHTPVSDTTKPILLRRKDAEIPRLSADPDPLGQARSLPPTRCLHDLHHRHLFPETPGHFGVDQEVFHLFDARAPRRLQAVSRQAGARRTREAKPGSNRDALLFARRDGPFVGFPGQLDARIVTPSSATNVSPGMSSFVRLT